MKGLHTWLLLVLPLFKSSESRSVSLYHTSSAVDNCLNVKETLNQKAGFARTYSMTLRSLANSMWSAGSSLSVVVLHQNNRTYYETKSHLGGIWTTNSTHLFLESFRGESESFEMASDCGKQYRKENIVCCARELSKSTEPLTIAVPPLPHRVKFYAKVLYNLPFKFQGSCLGEGSALLRWRFLPRPFRRRRRLRGKPSRWCVQSLCYDSWRDELIKADALIFPLEKTTFALLKRLTPRLPWIGLAGERPGTHGGKYEFLRNGHDYWGIDYRADSFTTSDIPTTMLSQTFLGPANPQLYKSFDRVVDIESRDKSVAVMISHCGAPSMRDEHVVGLSKHFQVISYGTCYPALQNTSLLRNSRFGAYKNEDRVVEVLSRHLFAFAIPNLIQEDWVDEKAFLALQSGAIPILLHQNSTSVKEFLPCDNCAIFVDDFRSHQELGEFLHNLAENQDKLAEFHFWRNDVATTLERRPKFKEAYFTSSDTFVCRVAEVLRPGSCPPWCSESQRLRTQNAVKRFSTEQHFWTL